MNILDAMIENSFKKLEDGSDAFYPWGIFAKGKIVPNQAEKKKIADSIKYLYIATFVILIIMLTTKAYLPFFLLSILLAACWQFYANQVVKNYKTTEIKVTYSENMQKSAKNYHPAFKWFGLVVGIMITLLGGALILFVREWPEILIALFLLLVGIFCVWAYSKMLFLKEK
ncbi:MAG: hypothetical protein HQ564_09095 [Candidatus Saganbacteria bacterium]|nr:hypothetical protein [Candidatus Saganbacteria bacterium]